MTAGHAKSGAGGASLPVLGNRLRLQDIPPDGASMVLSTTEAERASLAAACGLLDLPAFTGSAEIRRTDTGVRVAGRLQAKAVAACVVSLAPVEQSIDEAFEVDLVREEAAGAAADAGGETETDPPDVMIDDMIDFGTLFEEHLVLALDPYPRVADAHLPDGYRADEGEGGGAFAGLAGLRQAMTGADVADKPKD